MAAAAERRSAERWQVDTHLDDLQSELEAGARTLEQIGRKALVLEGLSASHMRQAAIAGDLIHRIRQLRQSITQQRATLRKLRSEMQKLRQQTARRP